MQNQIGRDYSNMPEDQKGTLLDLRDRLYEDHGCVTHSQDTQVLINLFYHFMYEITQVLNPNDAHWSEEPFVAAKHEELVKLLNYKRPNHPYTATDQS